MRNGLGHWVGGCGRGLYAAAAVLACSCAADVMDVPEDGIEVGEMEDPAASEEVAQVQSPLFAFTSEFSWSQGQAPVDMGSDIDTLCYLTRIQGDFAGGGESVGITRRNGRQFLEGTSRQSGIGVGARCTPVRFGARVLLHSSEFSWRQGEPAKPMFADNGFTVCMLTKVQGKFDGGGEHVEVTRSNGMWFLGGGSQQSGVAAEGRCIINVVVGAGTPSYSTDCEAGPCSIFTGCLKARCFGSGPTDLGRINAGFERDIACALGSMSGKFEGGGEFVRIFLANGRWFLDAGGRQTSRYTTSAFCFV
jgi:hypothetical protein